MRWFFAFFLVSGFCSLVYEVVWLRLAMAAFGVTTPMISIVLSVFMGGLALGSWATGRLARRMEHLSPASLLRLYALAELIIGVSGIAVPHELRWGRELIGRVGGDASWASWTHHLAAGTWIAIVLVPYCAAMGATFPLAMAAVRRAGGGDSGRSFSYLYVANVLGATTGTLTSALVLIELLGFRGTLLVTAGLNGLLAAAAFALGRRLDRAASTSLRPAAAPPRAAARRTVGARRGAAAPTQPSVAPEPPSATMTTPWLLFATGVLSMAMEVVWVRQFTPFLGTVVYGFAAILALYLGATFLGSAAYRWWRRRSATEGTTARAAAWIVCGVSALLPLAAADPRVFGVEVGATGVAVLRVALSVAPFCAVLGFITPLLVDRASGGDPDRAGTLYAVNVLGCIFGPLVAGFVLLPAIGERWSLAALSAPLFAIGIAAALTKERSPAEPARRSIGRVGVPVGGLVLAVLLVAFTNSFETVFVTREVRRDSTATVIAAGTGMEKQLLVNGSGMTVLTPVTKMMVHFPAAFLPKPPEDVLVICFGMGTSFRSSLSWGSRTTGVELIPSVPALFDYFHADARRARESPRARIVIDDGRRFLERSPGLYDLITVDPPPPVEAAGSSLLNSREFFALARSRLKPQGILHHWFPTGETLILAAMARSMKETFPHVRVFRSHLGWGYHFLSSDHPIPPATAEALAAKLPPAAAVDLVEWEPTVTPVGRFGIVLGREVSIDRLITRVRGVQPLLDDHPVNEYYFLRRLRPPPR
jgi:spermidine synthase